MIRYHTFTPIYTCIYSNSICIPYPFQGDKEHVISRYMIFGARTVHVRMSD